MWVKYLISGEDWKIALKFNMITDICVMGCWRVLAEKLEALRLDYFKISRDYERSFPMHNKVKFEFKCSYKKFKEVLNKLEEDGFVVQVTPSHGRIMR